MSEKVTYEELLGKANKRSFEAVALSNKHNARLIAHTLNEFPKLVEALEMADRMLRTQGVVCFKAEQALKDAKEVGR